MHKNVYIFVKTSKTCHVGTHLIALTEYSQMSTHMPGFSALICIGQISQQQYKG